MNLITSTKLTGAKRLHRKYMIENGEDFKPSFEHEQDKNTFEFAVDLEEQFKEEVEEFKVEQRKRLSKELRKVNIIDVQDATQDQGTVEWLKARSGIITASKTPFDIKGNPIPTFDDYINKKVADRFRIEHGGIEEEGHDSLILQRGHELEPRAIELYEAKTGNKVVSKGLVVGKNKPIGASPDGITSDEDFNTINIEIKSVMLPNYIAELVSGKVAQSYKAQLQTQMFVLNVDVTHFLVQCQEELDVELDLIIREIHRDEEYISNMIETIKLFEEEFEKRYERLKGMM